MDAKQLSAIAQAFQDVVGSPDGKQSVNYKFLGDNLQVTYMSTVYFAEERSMREQVRRETERSVMTINDAMKKMNDRYKEITGKGAKLKEVRSTDNLEIISATATSPRRIAYYRRYVDFEIG
jgi:hypothetical protein